MSWGPFALHMLSYTLYIPQLMLLDVVDGRLCYGDKNKRQRGATLYWLPAYTFLLFVDLDVNCELYEVARAKGISLYFTTSIVEAPNQ